LNVQVNYFSASHLDFLYPAKRVFFNAHPLFPTSKKVSPLTTGTTFRKRKGLPRYSLPPTLACLPLPTPTTPEDREKKRTFTGKIYKHPKMI
jgi:hypothetical protein